jgi:DNA-directed RNA polymerase I, II, and III subunit RPABC2
MSESEEEEILEEEEEDEFEDVIEEEEEEGGVIDYEYDGDSAVSDDAVVQTFDDSLKHDLIEKMHPQEAVISYDEVKSRCGVQRDEHDRVTDPLHTTTPILTKYECARVLGLRAKQINSGSPPFVDTALVDGYLIAQIELREKKIPFILRRPLPNGEHEYWRVSDLEIL